MELLFEILRRDSGQEKSYWEQYSYVPAAENETVATALTRLNETLEHPIRWSCSCLQKKCGACAMVINGHPALACDTFLSKAVKKGKTKAAKKGKIRLEPLHKFPVIADLMVDRSVMFENLKTMEVWGQQDKDMAVTDRGSDTVYEASRCLQCGCCLEVCPNFCPEDTFFGAAAFVPTARLLASLPGSQREQLTKNYQAHAYEGCGKSLACQAVCPAKIPIEQLMSRSNAAAVWRRRG